MFSNPSDTLVIDTARLQVWRRDDDYAYGRELVPSQDSLMDWVAKRLNEFFENIFGSNFYQDHHDTLWICIGLVALGAVLAFLLWKHPELFARSGRRKPMEYEITEDTIYGVDFPSEIEKALENENFREALRLMYLQTLKSLSDYHQIEWQPFKTPTQYTFEFRQADFKRMTSLFVRVRYGGFGADKDMIRDMHNLQVSVDNFVKNLGRDGSAEQNGGISKKEGGRDEK